MFKLFIKIFLFIRKSIRKSSDNIVTFPMHPNGMEDTIWNTLHFDKIDSIDANTGIIKFAIFNNTAVWPETLFPNQSSSYLIYNNDIYYFEDLPKLAVIVHNDNINNILDNI